GLRAGVAVVTRGAVDFGRSAALTRLRIARPGLVALIGGRADDRIRARARPRLARVGLRAGVAVVAGRAVRLGGGVGALPRRRVGRAGRVAVIEGRADDRIRARARPRLAGVGLRAGVAVVARGGVGRGGCAALTRRRVARPHVVPLIGGCADDRIRARARARLAGVRLRAGVAVIAGRAVRFGGGVGALPRLRIARPGVVPLIGGRADDRIRARARARLAGVCLRAGGAVIAERAVHFGGGVGALPRRGIARPRLVALIDGRADDWIRARTRTRLAGVR